MTATLEIRAIPSPLGNRIDLEWVCPDPGDLGVRIVRRQGTWPTAPEDGEKVVDLPYTVALEDRVDASDRRLHRWQDQGLDGETVFYYMLFPFTGSPPDYRVDDRNRAAAMATSPYGYGARLAAMLPAIYHRYDNARELPPELLQKLTREDRGKGPLRRLLEITGSQLDQLHSLARSVLDLHDLEQVDARLLPLLASWIGWPTDHRLEPRAQRSEIRKAPHVYRTIGLVRTVEATVKRILGWESRTKELAHNVFLSNQPERLNLWLAERDRSVEGDRAGAWSRPNAPLSLNFAYEGRPAAASDGDGKLSPRGDQGGETLWLFFHTLRKRTKKTLSGDGSKTSCRRGQWDVWYKTSTPREGWTESRPLTDSPVIDKHPSAALQGDTLWVFWDSWSESDRTWHLCYRTRQRGEWASRRKFRDDGIERRLPQAVADDQGRLWLFWLERVGGRWLVRYNRRDDTGWQPTPAGDAAADGSLRDEDEQDPRTEDDLFVLLDSASRLWVFWSRRDRSARGRWRIAYRIKPDLDFATWNWGTVHELPPLEPEASDREPTAVVEGGNLELYWSSNRDRSWSIWRAALSPDGSVVGEPEKLTGNPFSHRAPLAISGAAGIRLFYYSNESTAYASETYRATHTVDGRYAGSTTVDTRNVPKNALRGGYQDFQTYTFGNTKAEDGHGQEIRYAHDTVALYVTQGGKPAGSTVERQDRERNVLDQVLRQFLPIQVRAMLILEPPPYKEAVYTYDFPDAESQRVIGEVAFDSILPESYDGLRDEYQDIAPGWDWIYSWSPTTPESHRSVLFSGKDPVTGEDVDPENIDTSQRTWHIGLKPGGKT